MNRPNELFDDRIADWLEDDPVLAPPQLLETVIAAMPSIPQRPTGTARIAWRHPAIRFGLAAALVLAIGLVALSLSRLPAVGPALPTPGSSEIPLGQRVEAPLHYYAISLPSDWRVAISGTTTGPDQFDGPAFGLSVRMLLIPSGTSQDAWSDAYYATQVATLGAKCLPNGVASFDVARVGTESALQYPMTCPVGFLVLTAVGDRAYDIRIASTTTAITEDDRALMRRILAAVELAQGPTATLAPGASP